MTEKDDKNLQTLMEQFKCSIELSISTKGTYSWSIKVRDMDDAKALERLEEINKVIAAKYGGVKEAS